MTRIYFFVCIVAVVGLCTYAWRGRGSISPQSGVPAQAPNQGGAGWNAANYQQAKDEALALSQKQFEEYNRNPPAPTINLPNFPAGPGSPNPIEMNLYEMRGEYTGYLLCTYDVQESLYDPNKEPGWFLSALGQIRDTGPEKFPAFKWVAVVIHNRAEQQGESTFEQSYKAGAIFSSTEVFDSSHDLSQMASQATVDHHPFVYDPTIGQSWEAEKHQRWVIVERHEAATRALVGSN